jgi:hypothetical protein
MNYCSDCSKKVNTSYEFPQKFPHCRVLHK